MQSLLSSVPSWVKALGEGGQVGGGRLPLTWLDEGSSAARRAAMLDAIRVAPFGEPFQSECARRVAFSIPVASLPPRAMRLVEGREPLTVLFDPAGEGEDGGLFAALGDRMPSLLWVPLGRTMESLARALAPYLVDELVSTHELPRVERVFMGTADELDVSGIDDLGQLVAAVDPWIDVPFWSNADTDDPWPLDTRALSHARMRSLLAEGRRQIPTRHPSRSFRTLWSRSVLRVEHHAARGASIGDPLGAPVVFELRFVPTHHPSILRELSRFFPSPLPEDAPLDLLASILRGPTLSRAALREALAAEGPTPRLALAACGIEPAETTTAALLRAMMGGEHERAAVDLARAYGFVGLLHEARVTTRDAGVAEALDRALELGPEEGEA